MTGRERDPEGARGSKAISPLVLRHWPLTLAMLALGATIAGLTLWSLSMTRGHPGYFLDDAYIHTAMAKHVSQAGVWGVTPYEFSSSSSSLLWTLALSLIFVVTGPVEIVPGVLNVVIVFAIVASLYAMLKGRGVPAAGIAVSLLLAVFLIPLPELVFTGMEHAFHTLLSLLFVWLAARALSLESEGQSSALRLRIILLAALLTATRYEGLFAAAVVCGLLLLRRWWHSALLVGGAAILPLAIYGLFSVAQGWYALPNSVLLKGETPGAEGILNAVRAFVFRGVYAQLSDAPYLILLVLVALTLITVRLRRLPWVGDSGVWGLIIFVPTALLHMQLLATRYFHRYDAYLVALGLFTIAACLGPLLAQKPAGLRPRRWVEVLATIGVAVAVALGLGSFFTPGGGPVEKWAYGVPPLVERARTGITIVPIGTKNIYEQQYQMGRFLQRYYQGTVVAANDIGAITFLADIRLVDLVGLGSMDVAERKRAGRGKLTQADVDDLTRKNGVTIAIVHDTLLYGDGQNRIPEQWIKVGQWRLRDNVVGGDEAVSFYALDPQEKVPLANHLREFGPELPPDVVQAGWFVDSAR